MSRFPSDDIRPGDVIATIAVVPSGDLGVHLRTDYGGLKIFVSPSSARNLAKQFEAMADVAERTAW